MEHTESWKPQQSLAGLLASFAGLCVIGVRVGADHPLGQTMGQLGVAIGVAALVGYAAGRLLKVLIREAPVPACPEIYEVSEGRSVFDHYDLSFDREAEAGPRISRCGPVGDIPKKRKEAMAMGSGPDG